MSNPKILFTGPVGAGKTTAIAAISDVEPFVTEEFASDETRERKDTTTVAMDYGMLKLGDGACVHLYGTPGQVRFDFMWEILTEGAIGLVLLLDNVRPEPLKDMRFYLDAFGEFIRANAVAIGVTRMDLNRDITLSDYHRVLKSYQLNVPLFEVDARDRRDVVVLTQALLFSLDPGAA